MPLRCGTGGRDRDQGFTRCQDVGTSVLAKSSTQKTSESTSLKVRFVFSGKDEEEPTPAPTPIGGRTPTPGTLPTPGSVPTPGP